MHKMRPKAYSRRKQLEIPHTMTSPIYIAGKVTGEPLAPTTMKFGQAQVTLQAKGHTVINPLEVVADWHTPWPQAMRMCLAALVGAGSLYALPCWKHSRGARLEVYLAHRLGIPVHGCPEAIVYNPQTIEP
jgi:hypothetical protein